MQQVFDSLRFVANAHEAVSDFEILSPLADGRRRETRNKRYGNRLSLKPLNCRPIPDVECFAVRTPLDGVMQTTIR
jgi:hypothetical protein